MASFFSIAGQVERLKNAGAAVAGAVQNIASAVTFGAVPKVGFTSSIPILAKAAENPLKAAAAVAIAINPAGAVAAAKAVIPKITSTAVSVVKSLSPAQKVIAAVATPTAAGILISSSKARESVTKAPASLANFGVNLGNVIDNPSFSNIGKTFKDNPLIASAAGLATAATVGGGLGLAANTVATIMNTKSTNSNTVGGVADISNNKYDVKVAQESADSATEIAKIQSEAALNIAKEQTKQYEMALEAAKLPSSSSTTLTPSETVIAAPKPKKKATKKKKTKKKAKPKPKKKAKKKAKPKKKKKKVLNTKKKKKKKR